VKKVTRPDKLAHQPISNGRFLLDILKAIAKKEAQTRREPKSFGKRLRSLNDALGKSSVAIL
jgi:hypothetical protein